MCPGVGVDVDKGSQRSGAERMPSDGREEGPELREEIREARGRILELLASVVLLSVLLGLAINLGATLLAQFFGVRELLLTIAVCILIPIAVGLLLLPRISATVKEFHEDIEIVLPLLIEPDTLEVLRVTHYQDVSEMAHAALARRSAEERRELARTFASGANEDDVEGRSEVLGAALELTQFVLAVRTVQESRRLLGPEALYHTFRAVALAQSATVTGEWHALALQVPGNRYLGQQTTGVPQRTLLPAGVHVTLPEVAPQVFGKRQTVRKTAAVDYVTLLTAAAGKDTALRISGLAVFSEHRLPALNAPHRGLTARCVLRNVRDTSLRDLAREEEAAAALLTEHGRPLHPPAAEEPDPAEQYARLFNRLYGGGRRVRLLRIYLRCDGAFPIRLFGSDRGQHGLYLWGTALTRALGRLDIEHFMAILKDEKQKTPKRTF